MSVHHFHTAVSSSGKEFFEDADSLTALLRSRIKACLKRKQWSQSQLALYSGLSVETVKKLLGGRIKAPSFYSIYRICIALDISPDALCSPSDSDDEADLSLSQSRHNPIK